MILPMFLRSYVAGCRSVRTLATITASAILVSSALGCAGKIKVTDSNLVTVTAADVQNLLASPKAHAILVDARSAARFDGSHIAGALNITLPDTRAEDFRLTSSKTIIVYGADFDDPLAIALSKRLLSLGYKDVRTYQAGFIDWKIKGFRIESADETSMDDASSDSSTTTTDGGSR